MTRASSVANGCADVEAAAAADVDGISVSLTIADSLATATDGVAIR